MQMKRFLAFVILFLSPANTLFIDGQSAESSTSQADTVNSWVRDNYRATVRKLLPEELQLSPFPADTQWVVVVGIRRVLSASEYWVSVTKKYNGTSAMELRIPHESLSQQMRELKEQHPSATVETIARMIRIDRYEFNERKIPELNDLIKNLERIRIGPIAPDSLGSDLWEYHYWTESQYGQQMSAELVGFGPGAKKQPHQLVDWAEQVRAATQKYLKSR